MPEAFLCIETQSAAEKADSLSYIKGWKEFIDRRGMEYGQTISFCDLRWGVNTGELDNEEGARKVLSVRLNEWSSGFCPG